jgi:hypothetical protein
VLSNVEIFLKPQVKRNFGTQQNNPNIEMDSMKSMSPLNSTVRYGLQRTTLSSYLLLSSF